jgi:hypothetical protein
MIPGECAVVCLNSDGFLGGVDVDEASLSEVGKPGDEPLPTESPPQEKNSVPTPHFAGFEVNVHGVGEELEESFRDTGLSRPPCFASLFQDILALWTTRSGSSSEESCGTSWGDHQLQAEGTRTAPPCDFVSCR